MAYEPSKEAVKAAAIEWSGAPFPAPRSITKARAALIAAHEAERAREADQEREQALDAVLSALDRIEAHRAKKG